MIEPVPSTAASSVEPPPPTVAEARAPMVASTVTAPADASADASASGRDATSAFDAAVFDLLGAISRANQTGETLPLSVGRAYNAVLGTLPAR